MTPRKTEEQLLKDYEQKSEAILQKMMKIVFRAQRKVDDEAYAETLKKLRS